MTEPGEAPARPLLTVVRGVPDGVDASVEVAVLTAVLASRGGPTAPEPAPLSVWAARERLVRRPVFPSPDGWRASALPR